MSMASPPSRPLLERVGRHVAGLTWEALQPATTSRLPLAMLDVFGCARAGNALAAQAGLAQSLEQAGGPGEAGVWYRAARLPAAHAALVNGAVAHHVEMDDGSARASVHGGAAVVPAALAVAEQIGAGGRELLTAIAAGYGAAVACGRPLLPGIAAHRLHPPSIVGGFGAAAAAARLLKLDGEGVTHALSITALLVPAGPFEAFTKGATVKDLYAGWPAYTGVLAASLAGQGMCGPADGLEAAPDGLAGFYLHRSVVADDDMDPDELLHVQFKTYATCRSVQPALTALEALLPLDPDDVQAIEVETYPFAVELSRDSDPRNPIGAKTSIPYGIASYVLDGHVGPDAFAPSCFRDAARQALAARVRVAVAEDMVDPLVRGARLRVVDRAGQTRRSETRATRWTLADPASDAELRQKFRRLAGDLAPAIEDAVDGLADAPTVADLVESLHRWRS